MTASILASPPAAAQDDPPPEPPNNPNAEVWPGVGVDDLPAGQDSPRVQSVVSGGEWQELPANPDPATNERGKKKGWAAGSSAAPTEVGKAATPTGSPVTVKLDRNDVGRGRGAEVARVDVNVLRPEHASQLSPFSAVASVGFVNPAGREVTPGKPFELTLDLSDVALGDGGGDLYERLTITQFENCELFEPSADALEAIADTEIDPATVPGEVVCDTVQELDATFDIKTRALTATVDLPQIKADNAKEREVKIKSGVPARDLNPKAGKKKSNKPTDIDALTARGNKNKELPEQAGPKGQSASQIRLPLSAFTRDLVLQAGSSGPTGAGYGVTSNANSSSGDFSALPVPTLTDAQVGLFTGSAETSYPIPVPPAAAGPAPSVSFVYSSASVDGMTMGSNNQTGPLGTGWSLAAGGSIQRGLKACNDPAAPGDRCISSAPDDVYTMNLAGKSSKLIRIDGGNASTNPKEFRLQSDPFWRIRLYTGSGVTNPDHRNEWWAVETGDGTVYRLGTSDKSVDWLPVWYPNGGCSATYSLCDTARQWNVTTVTDVYGNQMTYDYNQEFNWYNARGISTTYKRKYVKASQIQTITYGANPTLSPPKAANARIMFNWEQRCGQSSSFGGCGTYPNAFHDTPSDLWCGPHANVDEYPTVCGEKTPTFWTHLRLAGVYSQVASGSNWVTTAHHDPNIAFVQATGTDGEGDPVNSWDSKLQQVVQSVSERPIDANGTSAGGDFERNGFDVLWAKTRDAQAGTFINQSTHDIGTEAVVTSLGNNDWIKFDNVWMGDQNSKAAAVTIRVSGIRTGNFRIRKGSPTGTILATKSFNSTNFTNNIRDFETFTIGIASNNRIFGKHNIYLTVDSTATSAPIGFASFIQFGKPNNQSDIAPLPEVGQVVFNNDGYDYRPNRLNHPGGVSAMHFPRIKTVTNQLGGEIKFTYGQNQRCDTGVALPAGTWDQNRKDCFPQWDASPAGTANDGWAIFNKWTVQSMTRGDSTAATPNFDKQPDVVTTYNYSLPGWGFADNPDSSNDTWNEFRGYNKVTVTDAAGKTETRFHQGLHGEPKVGGGTRTINVSRSDGTTIQDHYALRGQSYESRRLTSGGTEISRSWTVFTNTTTTPVPGRDAPRFTAPSQTDARMDQTANTRTKYAYNDWGQTVAVNEQGNTASSLDNRTTSTRYYGDNTSATIGAWRQPFPCVTAVRAGNDMNHTVNATAAGAYLRWAKTYYQSNTSTTCGGYANKPFARRTEVATDDTSRLVTANAPDNRGRLSTTTDPENNTTTMFYDAVHGDIETVKNPMGWDAVTTYDLWRRPTQSKDVNQRISHTYYDEYSRVTAIRNPQDTADGKDTLTVTYGQDARPAWVQTRSRLDGNAYTNSARFVDGFGRDLLNRTLSSVGGRNWVSANSYDNAGRPRYSSSNYWVYNDNVTTFEYPTSWNSVPAFSDVLYDAASRPIKNRSMKGTGSSVDVIFETETSYNGFETTVDDPNDNWTKSVVDGLGRTKTITEELLPNNPTSYSYNRVDDLTGVNAPDGLNTVLEYDKAGRKLSADDPDSGEWEYTYDDNSNLLTQQDPDNTTTVFEYDDLNRPTKKWINGTQRSAWAYDPTTTLRGLLGSSTQMNGTGADGGNVIRSATYDNYGRQVTSTTQIPTVGNTGSHTFTTEYGLRDDSQPAWIKQPTDTNGGRNYQLNYTYSARTGAANTLKETGANAETIVRATYWNQHGLLHSQYYGTASSDGRASWDYDPNTLRLQRTRAGTGNTNDLQYLSYLYDNNGNIEMIYDAKNAGQRQCFEYDGLDRLTAAYTDQQNCDGHTAYGQGQYNDTYTYTTGGNINTKTGTGAGTHNGTYTYNDYDHAHAVTATSDGSVFEYNADGNMKTRHLAGQAAQTLEWNDEQRLVQVTGGGSTTKFMYDVNDGRVRRDANGEATFYADGGVEYNNNTGAFTYYHQIGGRTVGYTTSNNSKTTWMYTDQINSTGLTRDDTGTTNTQRYTPWGETRTNGNLTTDHTYTGQIEDTTTGLRFYNARYQDPAIGRFVSADTIIPSAGNGQDFNRYSYVTNNPVKYLDPSGHCQTVSDDGLCEIYGNGWKFELQSKSPFSYRAHGWLTTTADAVAALLSGGGERLRYVESGYAPAPEPDLIDLYSLSFPVVGADSQAAAFEEAQRIVNQVRSEPNSHFPFPVELADCTGGDCGTPISVGNVLSLTSDNFLVPGPVLVTEVHKYGWSFEALPGHIAAGGTVEFHIAPGSYAGVETVRLTVSANGMEGSLEAISPVFAEASGRFLWSQMAASMNCSARNAETGVARC